MQKNSNLRNICNPHSHQSKNTQFCIQLVFVQFIIKTGQVDDLYKSSSRPFEKELEGLYTNFDKAFLKLYPNFVEEFNSLLKPEDYY